jgi:protein-S-isoprenylcysteine O-methyltransferase Ste14
LLALRSLFFFLLLPGNLGYLIPIWIGRATADPSRAWRWLAVFPLCAGTALLLWCVRDFAVRGRGTLAPVDPPKLLVAAGMYRWVRNPMYVGVVTTLAGHALWFGSGALWIYAAWVLVGFHLFVTLYEEPNLAQRFGDSYRRYCEEVPRWLPRPPRRSSSG